jgi:Ca2+-binding EF-hand superfamily protein
MGANVSRNALNEKDLDVLQQLSEKSVEEIRAWHDRISRECLNGKLDKKQFVKYYKLLSNNTVNVEQIAEQCFLAFDAQNTGWVDFREFLLAYVSTTGTDIRQKLNYAFDVFDLDKNKVLDENEIRQALKAMFKLLAVDEKSVDMERCVDNVVKSLDENKDCKISKGEFVDGVMNDPYLLVILSPFS